MMLLDMKADAAKAALSQLLTGKEGKTAGVDFSKMLQELRASLDDGSAKLPLVLLNGKKSDPELLQLATLASESSEQKKGETNLLQLLKGSESSPKLQELLGNAELLEDTELTELQLLHPDITKKTGPESLRVIINDAKQYLKAQIEAIKTPEEMPKTLRGLVQLADKIGIDVKKITLEQVQARNNAAEPAPLKKNATEQPLVRQQSHTTEELVRTKHSEPATAAYEQRPAGKVSDTEPPLHRLLREEHTASKKPAQPGNTADDLPIADEAVLKPQIAKERASAESGDKAPAAKSETALTASATKSETAPTTQSADVKPKTVAAATHNSGQNSNLFEQQHAQNVQKTEDGMPGAQGKQPLFDTALSQLLRGEESTQTRTPAEGELVSKEAISDAKNSPVTAAAPSKDALELKIGEARQMARHFVSEIKEAVQNYKPPFTRIKIQLNPVKFGEVDVTMVQRGNNLHINISSNTAAITTLAQNASELRTQLGQNGMGNATMNFSSNANPEQQQQQQQRQHMAELYEAYENSENFELLEQLELIVPQYV